MKQGQRSDCRGQESDCRGQKSDCRSKTKSHQGTVTLKMTVTSLLSICVILSARGLHRLRQGQSR